MRNILLLSLVLSGLFLNIACEKDDEEEIDQIIGGSLARKGQYPYMGSGDRATLLLWNADHAAQSPYYCMVFLQVTAWMNTVSLTPDADRVVRRVIRVVRAPDYNPVTGLHNIAIVTLDAAVLSVPPVRLAFGASVSAGNRAVVAGWGYTGRTQLTTHLRHSYITIQSKALCVTAFNNNNYGSQFFICAASAGVGSCSLDAGSPLLFNGHQLGISSQSRCGGGEPIAGVDVRFYERWIRNNV